MGFRLSLFSDFHRTPAANAPSRRRRWGWLHARCASGGHLFASITMSFMFEPIGDDLLFGNVSSSCIPSDIVPHCDVHSGLVGSVRPSVRSSGHQKSATLCIDTRTEVTDRWCAPPSQPMQPSPTHRQRTIAILKD